MCRRSAGAYVQYGGSIPTRQAGDALTKKRKKKSSRAEDGCVGDGASGGGRGWGGEGGRGDMHCHFGAHGPFGGGLLRCFRLGAAEPRHSECAWPSSNGRRRYCRSDKGALMASTGYMYSNVACKPRDRDGKIKRNSNYVSDIGVVWLGGGTLRAVSRSSSLQVYINECSALLLPVFTALAGL